MISHLFSPDKAYLKWYGAKGKTDEKCPTLDLGKQRDLVGFIVRGSGHYTLFPETALSAFVV